MWDKHIEPDRNLVLDPQGSSGSFVPREREEIHSQQNLTEKITVTFSLGYPVDVSCKGDI